MHLDRYRYVEKWKDRPKDSSTRMDQVNCLLADRPQKSTPDSTQRYLISHTLNHGLLRLLIASILERAQPLFQGILRCNDRLPVCVQRYSRQKNCGNTRCIARRHACGEKKGTSP